MNVDDALYHAAHDYPGGVAALAVRIGRSEAVLNSKLRPTCDTHTPTLGDFRKILAFTDDMRPLHALNAENGMVAVRKTEGELASDVAVLEAVTALWSKNGKVGETVHTALADGSLSPNEMAAIREAIYGAQASLATLLARLEGMAEPMGKL